MNYKIIEKLGGRKFFYCLTFVINFTILLLTGYLTGDQFVTASLGVIGTLLVANTVTTTMGIRNDTTDKTKLPANPDQPPGD